MGKYIVALALLFSSSAGAQIIGSVRGTVQDPQNLPVAGAQLVIQSSASGFVKTATSGPKGTFEFDSIPVGDYTVTVTAAGFAQLQQNVTVAGGAAATFALQLALPEVQSSVEVSEKVSKLNVQTSTVQSPVSMQDIAQTPGADQANNLSMITDFVPGAYMVHDMLHMRGGHQVNWFFDGIPVVNTSIAANVAALINPKNMESLEVQRGGYSAEYGDRTYGFFNVVTPSGFDRDNDAEWIASYGNFNTTDDQFNYGGHTNRLGYYASVDGNRSDLGLEAPTSAVIHDENAAEGGFLSLLFTASPTDQFRWIASVRGDHYQIPNDPDDQDAGIRDLDLERDDMGGFLWTHAFSDSLTFTLAPYFHYNSAHYVGGPNDTPFILDDDAQSDYLGARAAVQWQKKQHSASFGAEVWSQRGDTFFGLTNNPGGQLLQQQQVVWANSDSLFAEDQYKLTSWLTLDLGYRLTHYNGLLSENAADPRLGASIRLPRVRWVVHGYYAYYYQPPPIDSITGPLLQFAVTQGYGFTALPGERDIQHDVGLTVPLRNWELDVDNFHTSARNFLDHDEIGNSDIFVPLTDLGAEITGTEFTLRSPVLFNFFQTHVVWSNQIAEGVGPITGGLIEFAPTSLFYLDHDQRNTVSAVFPLKLPYHAWITPVYNFGSGFLDGDGPQHLPTHQSADVALGKSFGETWAVSLNATNIGNVRYLVDNSNTFGGTHYVNPRQVYLEVRYKFHL